MGSKQTHSERVAIIREKQEINSGGSAFNSKSEKLKTSESSLNEEIKMLNEENGQLHWTLHKTEKKKDYIIGSLRHKLKTKKKQIESEANLRSNLECTNKQLHLEISELKGKLNKVEQELNAKCSAWNSANIILQEELNRKNGIIDNLELNHEKLKKAFAKQVDDIDQLEDKLDEKREDIEEMNIRMTDQITKINNLKKHINGMNKKITSLKAENNRFSNKLKMERENWQLKLAQSDDNVEHLRKKELRIADETKTNNNLKIENKTLTSKVSNLQTNLANIETQLARKHGDMQYLRGLLQKKDLEVSTQNAKNINLQREIKSLRSEISKFQTDNTKHIQEKKTWNSRYEDLQNELSKCKMELDRYKSCNVAVKMFELNHKMENLCIYIEFATRNLSEQAYTDVRACINSEINKIADEYKHLTADVESHHLIMPNNNFAVLLAKYRKVRDENETALKALLRNVYDIEQNLKASHCKMDEVVKVVDETQELIDGNLKALSPLIVMTLDWELREEEDVYKKAKAAYEEAKKFFSNVLEDSLRCYNTVPVVECRVVLPPQNVKRPRVRSRRNSREIFF